MNKLDEILLNRECKYGAFEETAKRAGRIFHDMIYNAPEFINKNDVHVYYEALHMIALKVARLVNGDVKDPDGWLDIAGYAMLAHKHIINGQENRKTDIAKDKANNILLNNVTIKAMEEQIVKEIAKEKL